MKPIIILSMVVFAFAACNNPNSKSTTKDSTSVISTPNTGGVSTGAEGTDTGHSPLTNATSGSTSGTSGKEDTTLRNGSNGLNNSLNQSDSTHKLKRK